jgi:hypothetical protein
MSGLAGSLQLCRSAEEVSFSCILLAWIGWWLACVWWCGFELLCVTRCVARCVMPCAEQSCVLTCRAVCVVCHLAQIGTLAEAKVSMVVCKARQSVGVELVGSLTLTWRGHNTSEKCFLQRGLSPAESLVWWMACEQECRCIPYFV